ncbi:MAG TPA: tetratricopeptide repeat protein [Gemmatimonadales bacterium]|nr:tetratricopeptide repeat protein [Gemmatimonadales bacterium]
MSGGSRGGSVLAGYTPNRREPDHRAVRREAGTRRVPALERDPEFGAPDRGTSTDGQDLIAHGLALAHLGRGAEAIAIAKRGVELGSGPTTTAYNRLQLARIYLLTGDQASALDELESVVGSHWTITPGSVRVDPNFASLRGNPRFDRLVKG